VAGSRLTEAVGSIVRGGWDDRTVLPRDDDARGAQQNARRLRLQVFRMYGLGRSSWHAHG
jgi:hypothetical protein